jgi:hypothetical protein
MPGSGDTPFTDAGNDPGSPGYDPNQPTVGKAAGAGGVTTDKVDKNVQNAQPDGQPDPWGTFANVTLAVGAAMFVGGVLFAIFGKD